MERALLIAVARLDMAVCAAAPWLAAAMAAALLGAVAGFLWSWFKGRRG